LKQNFLGTTEIGGTASKCPSWLQASARVVHILNQFNAVETGSTQMKPSQWG